MHTPIRWFECGCCGEYHPEKFVGDCRDDANRMSFTELVEDIGGGTPIEIVSLEDQEKEN